MACLDCSREMAGSILVTCAFSLSLRETRDDECGFLALSATILFYNHQTALGEAKRPDGYSKPLINHRILHSESLIKRRHYFIYFLGCRMVKMVADEYLTDDRDRKYYADHYRCCPPPLFIISVTLLEVSTQYQAPTRV